MRASRQGAGIEEGFFPQKARKGAAVLTSRTPFGMTVYFFFVVEEEPKRDTGLKTRHYKDARVSLRGLGVGHEHRRECLCH